MVRLEGQHLIVARKCRFELPQTGEDVAAVVQAIEVAGNELEQLVVAFEGVFVAPQCCKHIAAIE